MYDLPRPVVKTRGLLNLRAYKTTELLEYEDRYVMYPTKEKDGTLLKYVVWILKESRVVGIALLRDLATKMEENEAQRGMLVGGSRYTPAGKKYAKTARIELVEGGYASFDLFEHELVPKHWIASDEEIAMVLDHYKIDKAQLPRIASDDPAVKVLGARPGQVLRIERDSLTSGTSYYYRLVN
ncbi:MAG: DNA-directed RNA polymerase subunit H [Candidatus Thorarchaeota archaeon]